MTSLPVESDVPAIRDAARPPLVDRAAFQAELDRLRVREKSHTREGDAIAAARRRLPMVEVDPRTPLTGADGPVPLIDVFEGRSQLIAYFQMWHIGRPAAEQCEGRTFSTSHITELSCLNSRPRIAAGRDDDLGAMPDRSTACTCSSHTGPPPTAT